MPDFGVFEDVQPAATFAAPVTPAAPASDLAVSPANGYRYVEPTLHDAQPGKFDTPYYAAYTNSGDLAAATYAGDGQKVRLIDPKTGSVYYEGTGAEGAKYATGIANALSEDKGRKAAWAIQVGDGQDWTTTGYDRKDPKHSVLGTIADIALPALGAVLLPGVGGILAGGLGAGLGAAGGSAISSIAQGRSLGQTALRAGLSGLGAGVVGPAVGRFASNVVPGATGAATSAPGFVNFLNTPGTLAEGVASLGANTVAPLTVTAAGGGALGGVLGGAAGGAGGALLGGSGSDTIGGPPEGQPATTVDEVVVQAQNLAKQGLSLQQIVALGIPASVAAAALAGGGGGAAVTGAPAPGNVPLVNTPASIPNNIPPASLTQAIQEGKIAEWAAANPADAARLGLGALLGVGAIAGGSKGGGGGGGGSTGNVGTRESLGSVFSAGLPAPKLGVRAPRQMNLTPEEWAHYGEHPERSFFTSVPQGYARGGFAVKGDGDGREDKIRADLSDGEYVVDAETVAMLGNGSSKAGADALDRMRVKVRQHKGKQMVRGRFTAKAKAPHDYMRVR